ncbi:7942_t:CDS:2, partial [Cetraspora pellucida]
IRPELITIVKKKSSYLFECLFPNKDIKKFSLQLINWNNKNNFQNKVSKLAIFAAQVMLILPTYAE